MIRQTLHQRLDLMSTQSICGILQERTFAVLENGASLDTSNVLTIVVLTTFVDGIDEIVDLAEMVTTAESAACRGCQISQ